MTGKTIFHSSPPFPVWILDIVKFIDDMLLPLAITFIIILTLAISLIVIVLINDTINKDD